MGRVIDGNFGNDGGIWAELLSDRKFFFELIPSNNDMHTLSPWLVREGAGSSVYSPRSKSNSQLSLVRGGRVVVMQFLCNPHKSREKKDELDQTMKNPFQIEEDDETENEVTSHIGAWRAEVEQSGLGLNKGRAYRGYVWLSTLGLPSLKAEGNSDGSRSSSSSVGSETLIDDQSVELSDDSSLLIVEVWLNFRHDKGKYKPRLLARISNQELSTMMERQEEVKLEKEGKKEDVVNSERRNTGQYHGIQHMERQGKWRRFNFGLVIVSFKKKT